MQIDERRVTLYTFPFILVQMMLFAQFPAQISSQLAHHLIQGGFPGAEAEAKTRSELLR